MLRSPTPPSEHLRSSCDSLIVGDDQDLEYLADSDDSDTIHDAHDISEMAATPTSVNVARRAFFMRCIALFCACWLKRREPLVGPQSCEKPFSFNICCSASYILGPLKSRISRELGTGHTEYSLLISALSLNSTWTPLLSPLSRRTRDDYSPVLQITRLGVSMALGLVAGKGASFHPFYVATFLAGMSVVINLAYVMASRSLIDGAGAELEAIDITEEAQRRSGFNMSEAQALEKVAAKRRVHLRQITKLGDVFWAYVVLNIIQLRYRMSEKDAANSASYVLVGSIFLYPICGHLVDRFKRKPVVILLLLLSSVCTLGAYTWLALPPSWTHTAKPAIAAFGFGHGFSPVHSAQAILVLLVLLVPKIVPDKFISTALGAHKSLEQTGATIFQTLSGLQMDKARREHPDGSSTQGVINMFLSLNILQLLAILVLKRVPTGLPDSNDPSQPLLRVPEPTHRRYSTGSRMVQEADLSREEARRGKAFTVICAMLVLFAWLLFLSTAWVKLGRGH
ncbi:hypothetical protein FB45DRAFT_917097 [Roridomyces roridus]|uniref:MFS transporter n=1 Tax=Roridomyces roridus TaxID=1738132 RepID=A0AAD7BUS8_9AGAR|nr:hypothetical protein FB45DRAFT_917097 [Roridomyces roridus]